MQIIQCITIIACSIHLMLITGHDLKHDTIPNTLSLTGICMGWMHHSLDQSLLWSMLGTAYGFAIIAIVNMSYHMWRGKAGLGGGDAKMLAMLGSWLGPAAILPILSTASLLASSYGVLSYVRSKQWREKIPFGPWLAASAMAVYLSKNIPNFLSK